MKKAAPLFSLLIVASTHSLFCQIKNYIPIVKPVQYEQTKETFENIARKFDQKNYTDLAEIFRSFALGGHGSGFVYVDKDGENYIITNRHVVANAEFVTLEFIGKGSTKILYESCPIVYTDDDIDLAVVKFPDNEKVFEKSFSIGSTKQLDGQEIWSAGFPGLLGKPMWQFAKGNITNEEAYVDKLVAPEVSYLIQHSASIDPGNSGGPLMIKDATGDGYTVVGVNTWTITNRHNTFFAIPSNNLQGLVDKAKRTVTLKNNKDSLRAQLIKQCKFFAAEINSDKPKWDNVMGNISYAFVGYKGWDSFLKMLEDSDTETLNQLESRFFNYSPIEAMRYSILYQIWKRVYNNKKDKVSNVEFKGINIVDQEQFAKGKPVRTNFMVNGVDQEIEWTFEHGHWRINDYDLDKYYKKGNESKSEEIDSSSSGYERKRGESSAYFGVSAFATPYTYCFDKDLNAGFDLKGYGGSINFSVNRISLFVKVNSLSLDNEMKNPPPKITGASAKFFYVSQGIIINILNTNLSPYFLAGVSYAKFSTRGYFETYTRKDRFEFLGFQLGAGLKYKVNRRWGVFCEASCYSDITALSILDYSGDGGLGYGLSTVQGIVGVSFDFRKKAAEIKK